MWDDEWDAIAGNAPEAGFMQSSYWAEFKRAEGCKSVRYGFFEDDLLFGGATIHFYPGDGQEGFFICPEGPVIPWEDLDRSRACLRLLQSEVLQLAEGGEGGVGLRIEPHIPPPRPSLLRNWNRAPVDLTPVHSLILDIGQSDESILAQMHQKGRYNFRLSQRHGVKVRSSSSLADIPHFYKLFIETAGRNGFFAEPYGFFLNLGSILFPKRNARLYLAEMNGEIIAGILVVFYGRRATYLYGGSSNLFRRFMPNYALHFAAFQEARQQGCAEYDFYGYDPFGQPDHLYAGFSRFKLQFGGNRQDSLGAHDFIFYDRLASRLLPRLAGKAGV